MKLLRMIFAFLFGKKKVNTSNKLIEENYHLIWCRWTTGLVITTSAGRVEIRLYQCMIEGAVRPQIILVVDANNASEAMAKKVVASLKRELNHFAKFLLEVTFKELKQGEVAMLTNLHSANEACAFVGRMKSNLIS